VNTETPLQFKPDAGFKQEVSNFTLRVCTPIYWHDRRVSFPKDVRGGSCLILRFGERLIGVTAAHVLQTYRDDHAQNPSLICQLRLMPFALHDAVIDSDPALDIATFALSEDELGQISGTPIDCTGAWPPPAPTRLRSVSLAGFPEVLRVTHEDRSGTFAAYGALSAIEDFSEREILLTYDPAREEPLSGLPLPPLGFNLSGCSGGPVLIHGERNGVHRWFPAGIIIGGSNRDFGEQRGEADAFDTIRVRRIHFVREDGTITPSDSGWPT
jgi:hypothetical protein